jgi:hypothetical protein
LLRARLGTLREREGRPRPRAGRTFADHADPDHEKDPYVRALSE